MIRKRTDQAYGGIWSARRDHGEVGIIGLAKIGQAVKAPAELDDLTAVTQGIESVGVHAARDQITRAQRSASVAEDSEGAVEVAGLHGWVIMAPLVNKWIEYYPAMDRSLLGAERALQR